MKWIVAIVLMLPLAAVAITEPDTGTEYPDTVGLDVGGETVTLEATGVALREKTFLKVDVYTIVSYVIERAGLGEKPYRALRELDAPKRIQMDLRRGFGRDKLLNSFREVIEKNYDDLGPIAADMDEFLGYFDRDAEEGDRIVFTYAPGTGLVTELNGQKKGTITNPKFAVALWTVWFGEKPADKGMREDLLSALAQD
jgi:hypothetical protein